MRDKNLCASCKFSATCKEDMKKIFASRFNFKTKHRGASLLSLMVFFFAALVITTQVFFFSKNSAESVREDRDIQSVRMHLAAEVNELIENYIKPDRIKPDNIRQKAYGDNEKAPITFNKNIIANYDTFYDDMHGTKGAIGRLPDRLDRKYKNTMSIDIFTLDYTYDDSLPFDENKWPKQMNERIFPPMPNHYLIRVHRLMPAGNRFMIQALVESSDTVFQTKTYEEIWY